MTSGQAELFSLSLAGLRHVVLLKQLHHLPDVVPGQLDRFKLADFLLTEPGQHALQPLERKVDFVCALTFPRVGGKSALLQHLERGDSGQPAGGGAVAGNW